MTSCNLVLHMCLLYEQVELGLCLVMGLGISQVED